MSTTRKTPKLRFPEFTDDWEQRELGEIFKYEQPQPYIVSSTEYSDDYSIPVLTAGQSFILGYTNEDFGIKEASKSEPVVIFDDFTTSSQFVDFPFKVKSSAMKLLSLVNKKDNIHFAYNVLKNIDYKSVTHERHWISIFSKMSVLFPSCKEQEKIGAYFKSLDNLITLHQRELDSLKKLKKSLLQKMFPKNGEKIPELRFPEFTGDWEQRKLKEIACKVKNKNKENAISETFTNSAEFGIISQKEFFDHEVASKTNLDSYYIVDIDDFVYNPRISVTAPVGPINRNKLGKAGVMSPLYTVFKTQGVSIDFLEHYFKSTNWHSYMYLNGDSGARSDRFSIKDDVFFDMPIMVPCIKEQMQIGLLFNAISKNITLHQRELDTLKKLKKGLLQNMFV